MKFLALFRSYGFKGRNALFDFRAFTLWAFKTFLFILGNFQNQDKFLVAFFADEFIRWHNNLLGTYQVRRTVTRNIYRVWKSQRFGDFRRWHLSTYINALSDSFNLLLAIGPRNNISDLLVIESRFFLDCGNPNTFLRPLDNL